MTRLRPNRRAPRHQLREMGHRRGKDGHPPMWVADMDFRVAPAIVNALKRRVEHGVFGYTQGARQPTTRPSSTGLRRRHHWTIQREWILYTTGVVPAVSAVIKALTDAGRQGAHVQTPDYNCFFSSIRNNDCEVVEKPHFCTPTAPTPTPSTSTTSSAAPPTPKTTLFLLCNPHNPAGRVWTREELERMNDICLRHGVKVVSDEIHCELVMPGIGSPPSPRCRQPARTTASPAPRHRSRSTPPDCRTPTSSAPMPRWRARIDRAININEVCDVNPFGVVALEAAYNEGEAWLDALNEYLWGNYQALCAFFAENLPSSTSPGSKGTYLVWVDIAATGRPPNADPPAAGGRRRAGEQRHDVRRPTASSASTSPRSAIASWKDFAASQQFLTHKN